MLQRKQFGKGLDVKASGNVNLFEHRNPSQWYGFVEFTKHFL